MPTQTAAATLGMLRAKIRRIEGHGADFGRECVRLGDTVLDAALPWQGLPKRSLHELSGRAANGFAAALAGRALHDFGDQVRGTMLWCSQEATSRRWGEIYGPGLQRFGIPVEQFLLVRVRSARESLWVAETALRSQAIACVVAELPPLDLLTSRRLQLAAEEGGGLGLALLTEAGGPGAVDHRGVPDLVTPDLAANAAVTRWRVEAGRQQDDVFWKLDLWRCRGGAPGRWEVRWDESTLSFALVAEAGARTAVAGGSPGWEAACA